jgi:hypothetical protein
MCSSLQTEGTLIRDFQCHFPGSNEAVMRCRRTFSPRGSSAQGRCLMPRPMRFGRPLASDPRGRRPREHVADAVSRAIQRVCKRFAGAAAE